MDDEYTREQFREDVLAALRKIKPFDEEVSTLDFTPPVHIPTRTEREIVIFIPRTTIILPG